jgi:hypothetical protein
MQDWRELCQAYNVKKKVNYLVSQNVTGSKHVKVTNNVGILAEQVGVLSALV